MKKGKNTKIIYSIKPDVIVIGDKTFLRQLIINLISNAIAYGKENGWIETTLGTEGEHAFLSVEDNGIGIAEEDIPKIWTRFWRKDPSRSHERENNMGLGLSIVKEVANIHGGVMEVESVLGKGSKFVFKIPLK